MRSINNITTFLISIVLFSLLGCSEQKEQTGSLTNVPFPFQDTSLSVEERVADLISRLTIEEKMLQLFNDAPAIERLGIPAYNWWNEALHGVARAGKATVFPQAIGLAATWDQDLMLEIATAISDEARAKHHHFANKNIRSIYTGLTFWSPNINIFRDPRWGRGQETYGEDPYLTGKMAVNFINGLQGNDAKYFKTIATAKHYAVHSGPEHSRHRDNFFVNDRDLYETYLPAFKMAVEEANVQSVMCAYNRFRDRPCCGSDLLLQKILRNEFGFNGYVVSDCGGISDFYEKGRHEVVETPSQAWGWSLASGTDLNCENKAAFIRDNLPEAIASGKINITDVNQALSRLFLARFRLGLFDPETDQLYPKIPFDVVGSDKHLELAKTAAERSIVLLKNNGILPLKKNTKIAVIGPNASNPDVLLGNYNGIPVNAMTPLEGIQNKLGKANVRYSQGSSLVADVFPDKTIVSSDFLFHESEKGISPGLKASYYDNAEFEGEAKLHRIDEKIDFQWDTNPVTGIYDEEFSVKWEGLLIPEFDGHYIFNEDINFKLEGKSTGDKPIHLQAKKKYNIVIRKSFKSHWWANVIAPSAKWSWIDVSNDLEEMALEIAENSEVIIFCGGISPRLEGEEMQIEIDGFSHGDRTYLHLPQVQEDLLRKLNKLGKPIIYVNFSGSAVALNWENDNLDAILQAFYPGEATGLALANIIFGDSNPSAKLPVSFYRSVDDLPAFENYAMAGRTYRYFDKDVLYPFGHGLSYTDFIFSELKMPDSILAGESFSVQLKVSNNGKMTGRSIIQVYVTDMDSDFPKPICSLKSFKSIELQSGESRMINFDIQAEDLAVFNDDFEKILEPGTFSIHIGSGMPGSSFLSENDQVSSILTVKGNTFKFDQGFQN